MSIGRWMDKKVVLHIHNEILLSYKKNAFQSVLMMWMNLEPMTQSEASQKEKDKYCTLMHAYLWNLERWYWWTYLQGSNGDTDLENTFIDMRVGVEGEGGMKRGSSMETYTLPQMHILQYPGAPYKINVYDTFMPIL